MPTSYWARIDSNTANNPALNLTGDPSVFVTFVPSGTGGDILLDANGGAADPDTQIEIDGVTYDFIFESSSTLPSAANQGGTQVPTQFQGSTLYLITIIDYPTAGDTTRLAFLPEDEATQADMDAFGNGAIRLQNIDPTGPGVICFAAGTRLMTPTGERPVEELAAGDLVETVDAGHLPIVWISSSRRVWPGSPEKELPILIARDALAPGRPVRDLVVSPQHKVLLSAGTAPRAPLSGSLAPAKGLTGLPGVRQMKGKREVTYYHVLLDRHAILISEGLPTESFYPGPTAMSMLRPEQKLAVLAALGRPAERYGPQARPCLTVREARTVASALKRGVGVRLH